MFINNIEFAKNKQSITGQINLIELARVDYELTGIINYKLNGRVARTPMLDIFLYGTISASCQFCLDGLSIDISQKVSIPIFNNQTEYDKAVALESNLDGILAKTEFNYLELIEDEVIMLLPVVFKHDKC